MSRKTFDQKKAITKSIAMKRKGMSNVDIARAMGCNPSCIGHWIRRGWEIGIDYMPSINPEKEFRIKLYTQQVERGEHITFLRG